jgi:Holliday junction resolvase RusA-like endonuclease
MKISFIIPGVPEAKARPRARIVDNKHTGKQFVSMYTPKKTATFENSACLHFCQQYNGAPIDGPVQVEIRAFFPILQSWPKWKKYNATVTDVPKITKPDVDNLAKSVIDGLNTVAFKDDAQVYKLIVEKYYSEKPRTEITISNDPF